MKTIYLRDENYNWKLFQYEEISEYKAYIDLAEQFYNLTQSREGGASK